jgi:hypothetical protein
VTVGLRWDDMVEGAAPGNRAFYGLALGT